MAFPALFFLATLGWRFNPALFKLGSETTASFSACGLGSFVIAPSFGICTGVTVGAGAVLKTCSAETDGCSGVIGMLLEIGVCSTGVGVSFTTGALVIATFDISTIGAFGVTAAAPIVGTDQVGTDWTGSSTLLVKLVLKKFIASSTSNLLVIAIEQLL